MGDISSGYEEISLAANTGDLSDLAIQCALMDADVSAYGATLPSGDSELDRLSNQFVTTTHKALTLCTEGASSFNAALLTQSTAFINESTDLLDQMTARVEEIM